MDSILLMVALYGLLTVILAYIFVLVPKIALQIFAAWVLADRICDYIAKEILHIW